MQTDTPRRRYIAQANTRSAANGRAVIFTAQTLAAATEKALDFFKCTSAALSIREYRSQP